MRWFFFVAAGLALIAGVQLFVLASETDRFFSWTIEPPLTAAFLGAAYWAAFVLLAWAARQRSWASARAALPAVFTIAVLLLAATLIHLDRFNLDSLFGWFWLVVYVVVTPLLVWLVADQVRRAQPDPPRQAPLPPAARAALGVQAAALIALGAALFIAPGWAEAAWPWTLSPLTGRAVGAFLIGFGAAAAYALVDADLERLRGPALAYLTLGVLELAAVAIHSGDLTAGAAGTVAYVAACTAVVLTGAYGLIAARASSRLS